MTDYIGSKDMHQDIKDFGSSQFGAYILETLEEQSRGFLAAAQDTKLSKDERISNLDAYTGVQSVKSLFSLDDDNTSRG